MKSIFSILSASSVITVLRMLVNLVVSKLIALYGGPAAMIFLGQAQYLLNLILGVATTPTSVAVVKNTAKYEGRDISTLLSIWKISLLYSVVLGFIGLAIAITNLSLVTKLIGDMISAELFVLALAVCIPINIIGVFLSSVINGKKQYRTFFTIQFASILSFLFLSWCLIIYLGDVGIILSAFLNPFLIGFISIIILKFNPIVNLIAVARSRINKEVNVEIKKYLLMGITSIVLASISSIYIRDEIIKNFGEIDAGLWQTVFRMSEMLANIFIIGITVQYLPALSELRSANEIRKLVINTIIIIIPIAMTISLFVYFLRKPLLILMASSEFIDAEKYVLFMLIAMVIKLAGWIVGYVMISRAAHKLFVLSEIIFTFSLVILTSWLTKYYGLNGATFAIIINGSFYLIFLFAIFNFLLMGVESD